MKLTDISRLFPDLLKLYHEPKSIKVFSSQRLVEVTSYLLHIPNELSKAKGLFKRSHLAPRPPKVNGRVLLWAGHENKSSPPLRRGSKLEMLPSQTTAHALRRGRPQAPAASHAPGGSVTSGKSLQLSYPHEGS